MTLLRHLFIRNYRQSITAISVLIISGIIMYSLFCIEAGPTPLHRAIYLGWESRAEQVIKANPAIVNEVDLKYGPPLAHALWSDEIGIAKLLIENGADIDAIFHGWTAENIAVSKKQEDILDMIHEVRVQRKNAREIEGREFDESNGSEGNVIDH